MIAQTLHRETILQKLKDVKDQLSQDVASRRQGGAKAGTEGLTHDDYREALAALETTEQKELVQSSGQESFPPQVSERRGPPPAPLDDFSFFSRDPVISNLQSALDEDLERQAVNMSLPDDRRGAVPGRRGVFEEVAVTDLSVPGALPSRKPDGRRLFDKFSITDVGWVSSAFAMGVRLFRSKHDFNKNPPEPLQIAEKTRLVVVGDWGTGLPRARKIATQMRVCIDEALRENREVHVIHLGDVYYSGWEREYKKRFLPYWPVKPEEAQRIPSWSLNGNHDMYSGGHAYYETLLADNRFAKQNGSSYFSAFNQNWRIIALDTAWDDNGLKDPQAAWLNGLTDGENRKLILLSHHQLFSAYETAGSVIGKKLSVPLAASRVRVWFWGHEHRCMLFNRFEHVQFARCIGHGGVPVYMSHKEEDPYPAPGAYEYRSFIQKGIEKWALFGFAVLDLEDAEIYVRYIDENGFAHKDEKLK